MDSDDQPTIVPFRSKLTPEQWSSVRADREAGSSFRDLAAKYGISTPIIHKRSKRENWANGDDVTEIVKRKAKEKVTGVTNSVSPEKKSLAINDAAEKMAAVMLRHQREWEDHSILFTVNMIKENFETGKSAKISAEMLSIRQRGERVAWGLDATDGKKLTELSDIELMKLARG